MSGEAEGRSGRWWWLPDWLWHSIVGSLAFWVLRKAARTLRKAGIRNLLSRITFWLLKSLPTILPLTIGFALMQQYVAFFDTPIFRSVGVGLVVAIVTLFLGLRWRAENSLYKRLTLKRFGSGLAEGLGMGFTFLVGAVLRLIYILGVALYPYLSNPEVATIFGVYSLFLLAVVYARQIAIGINRKPRGNLPPGVWF